MNGIVRFLFAGGAGVILYYTAFISLTELLGVWYMASAGIATVFNVSSNFWMHKSWTFQDKNTRKVHLQFLAYITMWTGLAMVNFTILYLLTDRVGLWYVWAQIVSSVVVTCLSYLVSKEIFSTPVRSDSA